MPRVRADNYDEKVRTIKDTAAELFATIGYTNAKLMDVARACGASKSMLYHYFPTKEDLLFAMIEEHLQGVIAVLTEVNQRRISGRAKFTVFLRSFLQKSSQARQRNMVAMNEVKYLPRALQDAVYHLETQVLDLTAMQLRELNPNLPDTLYKPYALLLLGMLNWTDTWYNPDGSIDHEQLVERVSALFLNGFNSATAP
jgi:AcrR family transcriptional regulator